VITPTFIASGPYRVSATYNFVCAIDVDQRAYCKGSNDRGELGFVGPGSGQFTQPVSNVRLTIIAPGTHHACGLGADGVAWCWGDNTYGQLGSASAGAIATVPVRVDGDRRYRSISVGIYHTCALATDGSGWCWGRGDEGELGDGTIGVSNVPRRVVVPVGFLEFDTGGYAACAIGTDGFTYCWGDNINGEVADGTTTNRATAQRIVAPR
jgi:alpha-tubulin suppressor-like RCC1 family protein